DSDSGRVLPIVRRSGDDHGYVLALGAVVFQEARFKTGTHASGAQHAGGVRTQELLWILGEQALLDYRALPESEAPRSQAFPDAGIYILREEDLYLLLNASDSGVNGRGSHGHN